MFDFNLLKAVVTPWFQSDGYKVATRFEEGESSVLHFVALKEEESIQVSVEVLEGSYGINISGAGSKEQTLYDFIERNIRMMIIGGIKQMNKPTDLPIWEHIIENKDKAVSRLLLNYKETGQIQEEEIILTERLKSKYTTAIKDAHPIRKYVEKFTLDKLPIKKKDIKYAVLYQVMSPKGHLYSVVVIDNKNSMYLYNFFIQEYMGVYYIMLGLDEDAEVVNL